MTQAEASIGTRVRTTVSWAGVPQDSEGVIDEGYDGGVMVAWDLPAQGHPLPKGYAAYDGVPCVKSGITRDGFAFDELNYLEVVK